MAGSSTQVGGLYVDVKLSTKGAVDSLDRLQQRGQQVIQSLSGVRLGLGAAVTADVRVAIDALRQLEREAKRVQKSLPQGLPGGGGGGGGGSTTNNVNRSTNYTQNLGISPNAAKNLSVVVQQFNNAKFAANGATNATNGLNKSFNSASGSAAALGQTALQLGASLGGVFGSLKAGNVGLSFKYLFNALAQGLAAVTRAGPIAAAAIVAVTLTLLPLIITAGTVVAALKQIGEAGIQAGNDLQQTQTAFKATLGTAGSKNELDFLQNRAESSVYDIAGLATLDKTLLAYNTLDDNLRQGLIDTLITLGTVGGKSTEQLQFGALALGQIAAEGALTTRDLIQLTQNLGIGVEVLRGLPEYANKSQAELKKLIEERLIPAEKFFEALAVRTTQYGAAAAEAVNTVQGQLAKIRTDLPAQIGLEFLNAGVQDQLTGLLKTIYEFISSINFAPIAQGFATVIAQVRNVVSSFLSGGGGGFFTFFAEVLLPAILEGIAKIVSGLKVFGVAFRPIFDAFKKFGEVWSLIGGATTSKQGASGGGFDFLIDIMGFVAKAIVLVVYGLKAFFDGFKVLVNAVKSGGPVITKVFSAIKKALTGDFGGAADDLNDALVLSQGLFLGLEGVVLNFGVDSAQAFADIDKIVKDAKNVRNEAQKEFESPLLGRIEIPDVQGLSEEEQKRIKDDLEARKKLYEDLAKKLEEARKKLEELTTQWFGFRSELEVGFLGDTGFEATTSQIAATGRKVIEILREVGKNEVADRVADATRKLIDLANLRDDLAEKLKAAEKKLEEAISARDGFAKKIREQAIAFANAFKLEETEVEKVSTIANGGVLGYLVSKTKQTKQFVDSLRERVATLKEFRANVTALAARGLDAGLLESLVGAGPDQAGDVVRQLAQSGDNVLAEVNTLQKELGETATKLGDENAKRFYQAGVDQAQAEADGLRFGINIVALAAKGIADGVYNELKDLASKTGDLGREAAAALTAALQAAAFISILTLRAVADEAARKASVIAQITSKVFQESLRIEKEYQRRLGEGGFFSGIAAEAFRVQAYMQLNAEIDKLKADPQIQVFIGQQEINDIVAVQVDNARRDAAVNSGTRR